jgi:hypothetical protein
MFRTTVPLNAAIAVFSCSLPFAGRDFFPTEPDEVCFKSNKKCKIKNEKCKSESWD